METESSQNGRNDVDRGVGSRRARVWIVVQAVAILSKWGQPGGKRNESNLVGQLLCSSRAAMIALAWDIWVGVHCNVCRYLERDGIQQGGTIR